MNRRAFLSTGVGVTATALPAMAMPSSPKQSEYHRLSNEKDDPGYLPYCKLLADGRDFMMYLDGAKVDLVVTIDAREGWIKRYIRTDDGNIAHSDSEVPTEIVHGEVEIRFS